MRNWVKRILENKLYSYLLTGYMTIQLSTLFFHSGLLFLIYELVFVAATVVGAVWIVNYYKANRKLEPLGLSIVLNFIVNLILTIVYIPTLILNSQINWGLEGGSGESDPMILLAFFPAAHFIASAIVFIITGLICKLIIKNE